MESMGSVGQTLDAHIRTQSHKPNTDKKLNLSDSDLSIKNFNGLKKLFVIEPLHLRQASKSILLKHSGRKYSAIQFK